MNSLLESIGGLGEVVKTLTNGQERVKALEAVINAKSQAFDLLTKLTELQQENSDLRNELRKHKEQAELAAKVFFARNAYWRKDEVITSAYCPTCFETKGQLVRLSQTQENGWCHPCKHEIDWVYDGERPQPGDPANVWKPRRGRNF
jgi:hypothetical protein